MKVAFALMVNNEIHNEARQLAYAINKQYRTGFYGAQLPPHISLKQPFVVTDLDAVARYFDSFAASIDPFVVSIPSLNCWVSDVMGSIFFRVQENEKLRSLHSRLNLELAQRFDNTDALYDGADYRFHLTIALGGGAPKEVYQKFYDELDKRQVDLSCTVRDLVMFYYDDDNYKPGTFITYRIMPLGR